MTTSPAAAKRPRLAGVALILMTAIWGSTFPMIDAVVETLSPADFLAVRFSLAAATMLILLWPQVRRLSRKDILVGVVLGGVYGVAQLVQTWGMVFTTPEVSGFITGLYVVLTPVIAAAVLRHRVAPLVWLAVAVATAGLCVLSLVQFSVGPGEALTLLGAVLYAAHIVGLEQWSTAEKALGLSTVQVATIALVCTVAAAPDGITLPHTAFQWWSVAYTALIAGAAAMVMQTWAQAHISAPRAAVLMLGEPVFAALFSVMFASVALTWRTAVGGALIVVGMWLAEFKPPGRGR